MLLDNTIYPFAEWSVTIIDKIKSEYGTIKDNYNLTGGRVIPVILMSLLVTPIQLLIMGLMATLLIPLMFLTVIDFFFRLLLTIGTILVDYIDKRLTQTRYNLTWSIISTPIVIIVFSLLVIVLPYAGPMLIYEIIKSRAKKKVEDNVRRIEEEVQLMEAILNAMEPDDDMDRTERVGISVYHERKYKYDSLVTGKIKIHELEPCVTQRVNTTNGVATGADSTPLLFAMSGW